MVPNPGVTHGHNVCSHFLTLSGGSAVISYGNGTQLPLHQIKEGMREKGENQEWDSTACNRSAQELLPEFRNFFQVINE